MHGPARAPGLPDRIAAGWSDPEGALTSTAEFQRETREYPFTALPQDMS